MTQFDSFGSLAKSLDDEIHGRDFQPKGWDGVANL